MKFEAGKLSSVVSKLQRRLNRLEHPKIKGSDRPSHLQSGSDDTWVPGPGPSRPLGRIEAPASDHVPSNCDSTRQSDPMCPQRSGDEERDGWLSADYRRYRDPLRTPRQPMHPPHAPEPAPPAHGRYRALQDQVPEEDMEWDNEGSDGDPLKDFGIS